MRQLGWTATAVLLTLACGGATGPRRGDAPRVLFIGNSLTYENDLPGMVAALAAANGGRGLDCATLAESNFGLQEHWEAGAQRFIAGGGWDVVVLQQGPSALPSSRVLLIDYATRFAAEIRRAGARPALYMVWPESSRATAFDSVSSNYRDAALAAGALLLPAGDAWQAAWRRDASLALYGVDGFHPSPTGTYLAALVVFSGLFERTPAGLPAYLTVGRATLDLPPGPALTLQQAAAEAIGRPGSAAPSGKSAGGCRTLRYE